MANEFVTMNPYDDQLEKLRQRQRMVDLLQQQALQPLESQVAPGGYAVRTSPVLGLAKMLQAYMGGREQRNIDKEMSGIRDETASAAAGITGRLFGEKPTAAPIGSEPYTPPALTTDEMGNTPRAPKPITLQPDQVASGSRNRSLAQSISEGDQLNEIKPTGKYIYDPADAFQIAMTPAGARAMQGNPALAAMLAQTMKNKFEPKSIDKTVDLGNKTRVFYSDGTTEDMQKGAAPVEPITPYQAAVLAQNEKNAKSTENARKRELDIREREAGLKLTGTPAQQQKIKASKAEDISNYQSVMDTKNELDKLKDQLVGNSDKKIAPHPGLSGITGAQSYFPNMPKTSVAGFELTSGDARAAQQILDTFKGKIASLGRQLQSTNGKLGNMAVQEWKIVADAVQKIDPSAPNFETQLANAVNDADALAARIRGRYENEYDESIPKYEGHVQATPSFGIGFDKNQSIFDKADAILGK